jgi:hypothetical protein
MSLDHGKWSLLFSMLAAAHYTHGHHILTAFIIPASFHVTTKAHRRHMLFGFFNDIAIIKTVPFVTTTEI